MPETENKDLQDRQQTRERLRREKPVVYDKLLKLDERLQKGEAVAPVIEVAYSYDCNLSCQHCFAARFERRERSLTVDDMRDLAAQAAAMDVYQFILQGGEPLFWPDFDEVVAALRPKEFYLGLVTNATLLDQGKIQHLRASGIDKLVISLDAYDAEQYEKTRNRKGIFEHTVHMLLKAREAGLRVIINALVTKQNVRSQALLDLIAFVKQQDLILYINFAAPIGKWEGRYDLLLDEADADYIYDLNRRHQVIRRDIYPYRGKKVACPALQKVVYITQYGDVLPCPFIHISVGNIFEKPLARIIGEGRRVKWFQGTSAVCLACEDLNFIKKKIARIYGRPSPLDMQEIFTHDEFDV